MQIKAKVAVLAFVAMPYAASAQIPVTDAANLAQQVQQQINQVTQLAHEVTSLKRQAKMLKDINTNNAGQVAQVLNRAQDAMRQARGIAGSQQEVNDRFNQRYPDDYSNDTHDQLQQRRRTWEKRNRYSQQDARRIQSQVVQSQGDTANSVQNALNASQSAAGQKSAIQATNQLLASMSAQMSQLQNLVIAQSHALQTSQSQKQAVKRAAETENQREYDALANDTGGSGVNHDFTTESY